MSFKCDNCSRSFKLKHHLKDHINMKVCIPSQILRCNACNKEYTCEKYYLDHIKGCKNTSPKKTYSKKKNNEVNNKLNEVNNKLNEIDNLNEVDKLNKKIDKIALDIEELKKRKPVVNQTVINNKYVQNNMILYGMEPLDLSQQRFDEIVDNKYTYQVYTSYGIVKDVFLSFFSNEEGKVCVMLSDRDRMKLKCIDKEKGIIYHDPKSMVGMCGSSDPLKEKTKEYQEQLTTNVYGEPNTVNIEDALKRKDVIKDEKIIKRLMSQSSEKFLKKEILSELLKDE